MGSSYFFIFIIFFSYYNFCNSIAPTFKPEDCPNALQRKSSNIFSQPYWKTVVFVNLTIASYYPPRISELTRMMLHLNERYLISRCFSLPENNDSTFVLHEYDFEADKNKLMFKMLPYIGHMRIPRSIKAFEIPKKIPKENVFRPDDLFAVVHSGFNNSYHIFEACDKTYAWIIVSNAYIERFAQKNPELYDDINNALRKNTIIGKPMYAEDYSLLSSFRNLCM